MMSKRTQKSLSKEQAHSGLTKEGICCFPLNLPIQENKVIHNTVIILSSFMCLIVSLIQFQKQIVSHYTKFEIKYLLVLIWWMMNGHNVEHILWLSTDFKPFYSYTNKRLFARRELGKAFNILNASKTNLVVS